MEIKLRDYQNDCIDSFFNQLEIKRRRHMFVLPTGSGKTVIVSDLIKRLNRRTLFLAHRDELIKQAVSKIKMIWRAADVGICKGSINDIDHQIVVGSFQTLFNKKRRDTLPPFDFITADECHHSVSEKYKEVLHSLLGSNTILLGVTATPNRSDQKALGEIFADNPEQGPDYERSLLEMISEGYLCPIRGIKGNLIVELSNVPISAGDYQLGTLSKVMNTPEVNHAMYKFWEEHARDRKTIVFAVDVQHAKDLTKEFQRHHIKAGFITGSLPGRLREQILNDFAENRLQVICNVNVLSEGFDEPSVSSVLFARPTKSTSLYVQMVGRALRLYPGKKDALILDAVKNTKNHSLVNITDLFPKKKPPTDYTPLEDPDQEDKPEEEFRVGRAWFESQSSQVYSSTYEWEMMQDGGFRLRLIRAEIQLRKTIHGWFPVYVEGQNEQLLFDQPLTVEFAMGIAEDRVRTMNFGQFARKDAAWRKRPASPKQLGALVKWGVPLKDGLTSGEADKILKKLIDEKIRVRR